MTDYNDDVLDTIDPDEWDDGSNPSDDDISRLAEEWEADEESEWDMFRDDVEADADALASAGFGTDEDYGYFGDDGW